MELSKKGPTGCAGCPPCCKSCVFEAVTPIDQPNPKKGEPSPAVIVAAADYGCSKGGGDLVRHVDGRVALTWGVGYERRLGNAGRSFLKVSGNPLLMVVK